MSWSLTLCGSICSARKLRWERETENNMWRENTIKINHLWCSGIIWYQTHKGTALLIIQLRIFQKWHRWNAFKISFYQNPGTFTYPILSYHPCLLNPCCWFQEREGNSVPYFCAQVHQARGWCWSCCPVWWVLAQTTQGSPLCSLSSTGETHLTFQVVSFDQTFLLPRKRQGLDLMCLVGSVQHTDCEAMFKRLNQMSGKSFIKHNPSWGRGF